MFFRIIVCLSLLSFLPLLSQAQIYVNSTNGNMDLSGGTIGQALAKAAGPALQAECTKKAPIAAGEIAVTGPGNIRRCQCIIHVNCPGFDHSGGQAEDVRHVHVLHVAVLLLSSYFIIAIRVIYVIYDDCVIL